MSEKKWENYGDVNFDTYGGCLVRPHWSEDEMKDYPDLKNQYDVFYLIPKTETGEDYHLASMYCVDTDEFIKSEKKDQLLHFVGLEDLVDKDPYEIMSPEVWAKEIVEAHETDPVSTYKAQYPGQNEDFQLTDNQLVDYMNQIEAGEFIEALADKGLGEKDININGEALVFEEDYIEAQFELWCDVDKKFDTDTRDDDRTWVNFYVHYFPEKLDSSEKFEAFYVVSDDENEEYFDYTLSQSEIEIISNQMEERARLESGMGLDAMYEQYHSEIER